MFRSSSVKGTYSLTSASMAIFEEIDFDKLNAISAVVIPPLDLAGFVPDMVIGRPR